MRLFSSYCYGAYLSEDPLYFLMSADMEIVRRKARFSTSDEVFETLEGTFLGLVSMDFSPFVRMNQATKLLKVVLHKSGSQPKLS